MKEEILDRLICLNCHQQNTLMFEKSSSKLVCRECENRTPVTQGIPHFVQSDHLKSFGLQWNRYEVAHEDEDRRTFQAKTAFSLNEMTGRNVLDAGCGGGRYSKILGEAGADVVGVDHTHAVLKAAELCNHLENVHFVQADLKRLPFPPASFDDVFSIGVMHHDVETKAVFDAVAKMVRPGGRMAVWLYRKNQWWQEGINNILRRRSVSMSTDKLETWSRRGAFLGGIPIVNKIANKIVNFSNHPHWENRVCDTFDWYAPQYQHHHTIEELQSWFQEAGFDELTILPPEKTGRFYRWFYHRNLIIGSGVNIMGIRRKS